MKARLGLNTGFALNRYPEHEEWARLVGETLDVRVVQLTADLLSPYYPKELVQAQAKQLMAACVEYDVRIETTFTGAFTRVNHLAHPDKAVRAYWVDWFKRFADLSVQLGADGMGSHFGILSFHQLSDPRLHEEAVARNIEGWHEIADYAKSAGLKYLLWEPMSIIREYGHTLPAARKLHARVNDGIALPMNMCLDVDHGDPTSPDKNDTDPYVWLKEFGRESPCVHIKQSRHNKGGHWPFTAEHNADGKIQPEKVLSALRESGNDDVTLLLELSFREREPFDSNHAKDLQESVQYWRPFVKD